MLLSHGLLLLNPVPIFAGSPAGRFGTVMFGAGFGAGAAYVEAQELVRILSHHNFRGVF